MNNNTTAVEREKAETTFNATSEYKIGHTLYQGTSKNSVLTDILISLRRADTHLTPVDVFIQLADLVDFMLLIEMSINRKSCVYVAVTCLFLSCKDVHTCKIQHSYICMPEVMCGERLDHHRDLYGGKSALWLLKSLHITIFVRYQDS